MVSEEMSGGRQCLKMYTIDIRLIDAFKPWIYLDRWSFPKKELAITGIAKSPCETFMGVAKFGFSEVFCFVTRI